MSEKKVVHLQKGQEFRDAGKSVAVNETECGSKVYFYEATYSAEYVTCPACLKAMKGGEDAR